MKALEKELKDKLKALDVEAERIDKLRVESNKINDKIADLNKKMRVSPSYELTQQLGNLISGRESFDSSLRQHETEFENLVRSQYGELKRLANAYVKESIKGVKEIEDAKNKINDLQKELIETGKELERLVDENWSKATNVVNETNLERYADSINLEYVLPVWWQIGIGMTSTFKAALEKEIRNNQEE